MVVTYCYTVSMKNEQKLLSRDVFRDSVFTRDNWLCVICKNTAKDAHHIIERRLFGDGGYYVDNGASLCSECHLKAESTELSCDEIRDKCGITTVVIPQHLYKDQKYDKWGNPILPNNTRLKGDLFYDVSVQKILKPVLHLFTDYVKYPRTYHLPWSPGITKDDRVARDLGGLEGNKVICTLKYDGENTTMYRDYLHARSIEYERHPSRSVVKNLHASICNDIPSGWRICGENVFAKHSIHYKNLSSYFFVFSIWNDKNTCLSWKDTIEYCGVLGLDTVPVLYEGVFNETTIKTIYKDNYLDNEMEGYVVRVAREFNYAEFRNVVYKYVRKNHVQSQHNWKFQQVVPNEIGV